MKAIVETGTNLSKYIFDEATELSVTINRIVTPHFIIGDLNSSNSVVHNNVTPPEDWVGNKYTFDGTTWTQNPDWVEPESE